jgi:HK97 family phage portal protein
MPVAFSELSAQRKQQSGIQISDGSFPLDPAYSHLLSRNPQTLKFANEGYSQNSIVFNCITRRAQAIHQPPLIVSKRGGKVKKGKKEGEQNDLQRLLESPNPYCDTSDLLQYLSIYNDVGGKMYFHKVRDGYGVVTEIYPYHASQISVQQGTTRWIDGYWYDNGAGFRKFIAPEDIGTFKFPSIDFLKPYTSTSPLLALAALVDLDSQVAQLSVSLLLNGGAPPFVIYPGEQVDVMTQDQIDGAIEKIITKFNGRNRGKPALMNKDFKLEKVGFSPKEMLLTEFSMLPETRICATYGVPVGYAQMLTGLEYAGTFANREIDKQTFYEDTMVSLWVAYGRAFNRMFKDEVFYDCKGSDLSIEFDYSNIPALMVADAKLQGKVIDQFRYNLITRDRALDLIGEEEVGGKEGGMYYSESTGTAFGTSELPGAKPEDVVAGAEPATKPVTTKAKHKAEPSLNGVH